MEKKTRKTRTAPARAGKMKLEQFVRSFRTLGEGEYPFEGCTIGKWDIPQPDGQPNAKVNYLALDTEDDGIAAIPSGNLFNCTLADEDDTIGSAVGDEINPIKDLAGTLIVTKDGDRFKYELQGVTAAQMLA